jgi:AcrR family transcriptional regulator
MLSTTTAEAPARRTQVERRAEAEQGLLAAAVRLFASKGIDQTSLADIGEEAGYSRGLVNHHFGTKAALVERLAEQTQRRFAEHLASSDKAEGVGALVAIADAYLRRAAEATTEARAFFVMWGAALPDDAALRSVFVTDDRRFRRAIEKLVVAAQGRGAISSEVNAAGFAVAFVGLLRGIAAQVLVDRDGVDIAATRSVCERFVRMSLAPPTSRTNK